jgi:flagellar hook-associated protein 3 FlgL
MLRIATETLFDSQTTSIDNLSAQQQQLSQELSSGKQINQPSDNPLMIGEDLALRTTIAEANQGASNVQSASSQLTATDGALSSLTNIMQSARGLAVQAGAGILSQSQRTALAQQVDSLLSEAIGVANTTYAGKYLFAGSAAPTTPPVQATGQPITSVTFTGNEQAQSETLYNQESISNSTTLQQAFNFNSANGSPDVFQTLINLRDALNGPNTISQSASGVNNVNTAFAGTTPINTAGILKTPLTPDASGNVNIQLVTSLAPNGVTITIPAGSTVNAVLAAINAQTGATGVTASFDFRQQRLILNSSTGDFQVNDIATPGAPTPGNFVEAFGLQSIADLTNEVSTQLGDIDNSTQVLLNARASVGGNIQTLSAITTTTNSQVVNDTQVQSGIEDADIAKVVSQFSLAQTALQAAYSTTTRLESKSLFDYLQ